MACEREDKLKTVNFLRGRRGTDLDEVERLVLEAVLCPEKVVAPRTVLVRRGQLVDVSTLLIDGLVGRYLEDRDGDRQLVALHIPGDFLDLHAFPLRHLDHDVVAISEARISTVTHDALERITENHPHLTRLLWYSTLLDAAIHREWIFRLGRLDGPGRVAHFMAETATRLSLVGHCNGSVFELDMTQSDIADVCGLTNVHVNRVLRSLRASGILTMAAKQVTVVDWLRLIQLGEFDPHYLYMTDNLST